MHRPLKIAGANAGAVTATDAAVDAADAAQALAQAVAAAMFARDTASQGLGMTINAVGPGHASMSMPIRANMLNGHQSCHGGFIFTLADSAFAFACNSYNQTTVGAACTIDYLAPGRLHDILTAEAVEQALTGKSGIYDVTVRNQDGRTVALFRGKSLRVGGDVVAQPE